MADPETTETTTEAPEVTNDLPNGPEVFVNDEAVKAQTTGPAHDEPTHLVVHETHVQADHVITDPHHPLAVQIPDAGRGPDNGMTPIGNAWGKGSTPRTPEEVFAGKAE